jgi:integrase
LFVYRGYLVNQRDANQLMPSTASARMSAVVRFYRWCYREGFVGDKPLWEDSTKVLRFYSSEGFNRTMSVVSSELSIPNRKRQGLFLEDGLLPITGEMRDKLLRYISENGDVELRLMLAIGFFTGARSGTIRTLRLRDIEGATTDPQQPGLKCIAVGPPTTVKTKYSVSGEITFVDTLLDELEEYFYSPRRLMRQALAKKGNRTVLFLTSKGNPYSDTSFTKVMSDLRKRMVADGLKEFQSFHFHQSRATFGTELMSLALKYLPDKADAICFVRDAMLHKDESTTWKYVKFIERHPLKEKYASEFYKLITGKVNKESRDQALEDYANE